MSGAHPGSVRHVADGALLVEFEGASDEEANAAAVRLAESLAGPGTGPGFGLAGLHDAVPGARTLFCSFDPLVLPHDELARRIAAAPPADPAAAKKSPREHRVPVRYGGEAGPDLAEVAARAGLSPEQAARLHADATYRVAFLGFAPGFAYMTGLPQLLQVPRRATPRPRVRAGSLAIAGPYAGIYPADGPGGWNLIGEAGARLFDLLRDPPALFAPGDLVRFAEAAPGEIERALESRADASRAPLRAAEHAALEVIAPGLWSAVCGAPRAGNAAFGAPPGGAMDLESLALGNEAVGNPRSAGALEMAVAGPELLARAGCVAVLSGAPCDARRDGVALPVGEPFTLAPGQRLAVGPIRAGVRAYLCVAGGLEPAAPAGMPRRLAAGDLLYREAAPGPARAGRPLLRIESEPMVRIVLGPQENRFAPEGIATLLESEFRVSSTSDRRGIRLEGPKLAFALAATAEIPPEGTALGAIQVPPDGQPIVLGPDRPVTGGYAKAATVIAADFGRVAQARPGSGLRFRAVSLAEAVEARRRMRWP